MRASGANTEAWPVHVPPGYRIGPWEVTAGIATGSWGSVYEARWAGPEPRDPGLPDRVALKFLPTGTVTLRQLAHLRQMTEREVRFHRRETHARLIRAFDALTVDDPARPGLDGAVVLIMERAARSLTDLLRRYPGRPVPDAAALVKQICEGLVYMHRQGWVHGDLKPSNVLLMEDGSVRLGDFGLTAELEGTHGYLPPMGSSDYLPPERWTEQLAERGFAVRTTADIWALGVTAYELFTGHFPFRGSGSFARALSAAEHAADRRPLAFPSSVPTGWQSLIRDCLAPTHAERQRHDAASLLARMQTLPAQAPARPARHASSRPPRLKWHLPVVAATASVAFIMLGIGAVSFQSEQNAIPGSGGRPSASMAGLATGSPDQTRKPDNLARSSVGAQWPAMFADTYQDSHPVRLAADGDADTFWVSAGIALGEGPTRDRPIMFGVDLGRPLPIGSVTIRPRIRHGPRAYKVQVSDDGVAWRTVADVPNAPDETVTTTFPATTARYLRLSITEAWDPTRPPRNVQVAELEVRS
jgi:serine/threonine protein kinase